MPIIRSPRPERDYYALRNSIIDDQRLSWDARAVLVHLLSKPDGWRLNVQALINETKSAKVRTGRDAVYRIIAELIDIGYMTRQRHADGSIEYTIYEEPVTANPDVASNPVPADPDEGQKPLPPNPDPGNPDPGNPDVLVKTDKAVKTEKAVKTFSASLREAFDVFYSAYPKKKKRADAEKAFAKLNPNASLLLTMITAIDTAKRGRDWIKDGGQYIPYPATWINGRQWEDEAEPIDYSVEELDVLNAYNAAMSDSWPRAVLAPFSPARAAAIREFISFASTKPGAMNRYFQHCSEKWQPDDRCGFDWLIRRDTFIRAREGVGKFLESTSGGYRRGPTQQELDATNTRAEELLRGPDASKSPFARLWPTKAERIAAQNDVNEREWLREGRTADPMTIDMEDSK